MGPMIRTSFQRSAPWLFLAPVLLALLANFNVLQNGFGWDDEMIIQNLRAPDHWWRLILPDISSRQDAPYYRPVVELSYMLDYAIWGHRAFGFHLSVLLAHLCNTALVFFLAKGWTSARAPVPTVPPGRAGSKPSAPPTRPAPFDPVPLLAASLFAVHPSHPEAVAWIAGRNDVFCTTFLLASLVLYLRFLKSGGRIFYAAAMLAFGLGLLTKETAFGLLLIFPLADYLSGPGPADRPMQKPSSRPWTFRRIAWSALIPLCIFVLYFLFRQAHITRPLGVSAPGQILSGASLPRIIGALGMYLRTLFFPYPHYPFIAAIPTGWAALIFSGLLLIAAAAAAWFAFRRREQRMLVGEVWMFMMIAPALALAALLIASTPAAERYLYAPSAGFSIFAAEAGLLGFQRLASGFPQIAPALRAGAAGLVLVVLAIGGLSSHARNPVWKNPFTFWEAVVGTMPTAGLPYRELGLRYADKKQPEKAEQLYRKAKEIDEKTYGPEHPEVGADLHNLASLYHNLKRYAEAETLYQEALAIWEKVLGPGSPDVATALNNLAALYYAQGKYEQAEPYFKRALAIWEKVLGPDNLDLVNSLNNLAEVDRALNRPSEAETYYKRALAIREKILGPDDPDLAENLENLSGLYRTLNRPSDAVPLLQRASTLREKGHGPNPPHLTADLYALASINYDLGRYAEAEPLFRRVLATREKALGPDHAELGDVLNRLAALYYTQGKYDQAEPLYKRALAIREKTGGPENLDVAQSLNNLGVLYNIQGRYAEAEPLYKRSLAIRKKILGPAHGDVATGLNNLAALYFAQGRYPEAESMFREALSIREKTLRPNHPDLATSLENYAALLHKLHRDAEAAPLTARARAIREKSAP